MSRIDRSKSRSAGGKGFYIALALCLAAVGAIGYFTLIRPANVTIDDPTPPTRQTERNDAQWTAPVLQPEPGQSGPSHRSRPSRAMMASSLARICAFIGPSSRWS